MSVSTQPHPTEPAGRAPAPAPAYRIGSVVESRPPAVGWSRPTVSADLSNQPPLDLIGPSDDAPPPAGHELVHGRKHIVRARWTVRPRPGLPDAAEWGTTLSGAVMQAWLGQRPVSQLTRWLDEEVLVAISMQQRRRRAAGPRSVLPVIVRSVRVQHPQAEVAEVAAHLSVGARSAAMALRLEAVGDRWLGTAVELGPRVGPAQTTREEVIE